jgi:hypothetical protein
LQKALSRSGVNIGPYDTTKNATNAYYTKLNELTAAQQDAKDLHGINSPEYKAIGKQIGDLNKKALAAGIKTKPNRRRKAKTGVSFGGGSGAAPKVTFGGGGSAAPAVTFGGG